MDLSEAVKIKDPNYLLRHPWEIARSHILSFFLTRKHKAPYFHIADIGCGDGYIMKNILQKKLAFQFTAVDTALNDANINKLKRYAAAENVHFYRNICELKSVTNPIDCILLMDVLEHVPDDLALVTELLRTAPIAPNAKWIITVPAFQTLFSKHDVQLKHYRRYTLQQLTSLCESAGLTIDYRGYFFFSLIPLRLSQKILLKFSKQKDIATVEKWKGGSVLTKIACSVLWADFKICFWFSRLKIQIPGLSCYCICH